MKKLLFTLIYFPTICFSQNWTQLSNITFSGRHHPITFANDNFGFVISGSYTNDAYKYDKSNDTWSSLQNIPFSGRGYAYGVAKGNLAYMGFGNTSSGQGQIGTELVMQLRTIYGNEQVIASLIFFLMREILMI